jgi:hypothetical protein
LGKVRKAEATFEEALKTATAVLGPTPRDVPEYYVAADTRAGLGDTRLAEAKAAKSAKERLMAAGQAEQAYGKGWKQWGKFPSPSWVSPGMFRGESEGDMARRLTECRTLPAGKIARL